MTNNTPDYKDNLYFEEKKMDCKNCPFTDEYCASGDCERDNNLTEQWKKGKLSEGHYYVKDGENMIAEYLDGYFYNNGEPMTSFSGGVDEVLAPVPTFDEWKASYNCMLENEVLRLKNAQLKDLLKECKEYIENIPVEDKSQAHNNAINLLWSIDEVLK